MPSRKTKIIPQWDEKLCSDVVPSKDGKSVQYTERAIQERKKRLRAFLAVRRPQKELDPRIFKIAKNEEAVGDELPLLHYGLLIPREKLLPYAARNGIKVPSCLGSSEPDTVAARRAVVDVLENKCGLFLRFARPFEEVDKHYMITLDDTLFLKQKYIARWGERAAAAVQVIREEFDLGDQEPMWWWDSMCGLRYACPIEDYNPPELNEIISWRSRPTRYDDSSDSSESESGSDTEIEEIE